MVIITVSMGVCYNGIKDLKRGLPCIWKGNQPFNHPQEYAFLCTLSDAQPSAFSL